MRRELGGIGEAGFPGVQSGKAGNTGLEITKLFLSFECIIKVNSYVVY